MAQKWQESSVFQNTSLDFAKFILRKDVYTGNCLYGCCSYVKIMCARHFSSNSRLSISEGQEMY